MSSSGRCTSRIWKAHLHLDTVEVQDHRAVREPLPVLSGTHYCEPRSAPLLAPTIVLQFALLALFTGAYKRARRLAAIEAQDQPTC